MTSDRGMADVWNGQVHCSSSVFTCIGALCTPPQPNGAPYQVSLTGDLCEGNKIVSFKKFISPQPVGAPSKRKKSGGPGHMHSVPIG